MCAAALAAVALTGCRIPRPDKPKVVNSYLAEPEDLASVHRLTASWGARFGPPASFSAVSAACTSLEAATSLV